MQLSERASELAQENDQLMEQNQEKSRQIDLVESEHQQLIKQSAHRYMKHLLCVVFFFRLKAPPNLTEILSWRKLIMSFLRGEKLLPKGFEFWLEFQFFSGICYR